MQTQHCSLQRLGGLQDLEREDDLDRELGLQDLDRDLKLGLQERDLDLDLERDLHLGRQLEHESLLSVFECLHLQSDLERSVQMLEKSV